MNYHRAIILHGGSNGINKEAHKHNAWMKNINNKENVFQKGQSPFFGTHVETHERHIEKKEE